MDSWRAAARVAAAACYAIVAHAVGGGSGYSRSSGRHEAPRARCLAAPPGEGVPLVREPALGAGLPLLPELLGICRAGLGEARRLARLVARPKPPLPLRALA